YPPERQVQMTMLRHTTLAPRPEAAGNAASIAALSTNLLPDGPARQELLRLANAGCDCYAYIPVAASEPTIWLGAVYPSWEGRMTCQEWQRVYEVATAFPTDEEAVLTLTRQARALWATARAAGVHGAFMRPQGIDDLEHALSYLRWRVYLAGGVEGARRFRVALADGVLPVASEPQEDRQEGSEG
ncbi:MAG TPA: LYR motif-containing protein, partial [Ktedonobacterales bacterium]|nr:LYR motif-containing protein [Ktedonobacterales bacterium]